jgi:hypothetical protein
VVEVADDGVDSAVLPEVELRGRLRAAVTRHTVRVQKGADGLGETAFEVRRLRSGGNTRGECQGESCARNECRS